MTNKIVILDNSVEFYEHYIADTKWERTLVFPRGGVTYLVSNGTIKFYAYEDYLYRNCLISMQLPIRVVDEFEHIDGEYEDIDELAEVLDRIFPTNDLDAELGEYLRIKDAELLYQPKGDYILRSEVPDLNSFVTDDELAEVLDDYYTKSETSGKTQIQDALDGKADKSNTYTKDEVDDIANGKADANDVYTKLESDSKFQLKGNYVSENTFISYRATTNAALANKADKSEIPDMTQYYTKSETSGSSEIQDALDLKADKSEIPDMSQYYTKAETSGSSEIQDALDGKADKSDTYTKAEVDEKIGEGGQFDPNRYYTKVEASDRFQPIGNYVSASTYTEFTSTTKASIDTLRGTKLDISAYTPSDLSNYYTKDEVYTKGETYNRNEIDDKITQSGTFDPTRYYTKSDSDSRFALKDEIPSLIGYASEEWVTSKNYSTRAELVTYVNNLQQQINSLMATVSGCCQTQEDVYRWITVIGEYLCENNDKYEKQKYQVSHDGGITWEDVTPIQYQKGQLIERNSTDCGYAPQPQYRWQKADTSDYMCSGTSKYYKLYYQVSYDGGQTWQNVSPEQTKIGGLIESNSSDCGYVTPQYRWYTSQDEYICNGTTKYEKQYYQVSNDGGETWNNVSPEKTRRGSVIEYDSTDCGYVPPTSQYRWVNTSSKMCSGYDQYYVAVKQVSTDGGKTWSNVTPTETQIGTLYQADSYNCGYVGTPKLKLYVDSGKMKQLNCESSTNTTLTSADYNGTYNLMGEAACEGLHIEIGDCVTQIGDMLWGPLIAFAPCAKSINYGKNVTKVLDGNGSCENCTKLTDVTLPPNITKLNFTFANCTSLKHMTIPSKVSVITSGIWANCSSLESLTFLSVAPPDLGEYYADTFQNTNNCILYVPAESVNAYKAADGWKEYASRIMPINS